MNAFLLLATMNLIVGGLVFLLGFIILRENPRQRLNLVVAAMLFFGGTGSILGALGFLAAQQSPVLEENLVSTTIFQNMGTLWEFFFPSLLLFALVFPRPRGLLRRHPTLPLLIFLPHLFHFLLLMVLALLGDRLDVDVAGVSGLVNVIVTVFLSIHRALFSLVNLGYGGVAALLFFQSYREASVERVRLQIRVIGAGLITCLVLYSLASFIPTLLNIALPDWLITTLTTMALVAGSGGIAYAIVRHKFLDAKLIARQAILYALASSILVGFYLVVIAQLNRYFTRITGLDARVFEPVFLILALILFQPAVSRLEIALEALFLRDPADYRNVIRRLGRDLLTNIDLDLLLARSIRTLSEALLLKSGYIVALSRTGPLIHLGTGDPVAGDQVDRLPDVLERMPDDHDVFRISSTRSMNREDRVFLRDVFGVELVIPLRTGGETVGALLLGRKVTGTVFTTEDVNLLTGFAAQMAVSLQNSLLLKDRVAVARFEEELSLARQIQRSFLPSGFPEVPRFDMHAITIPSKEVGGDLYDFVRCQDNGYLLAIADVSGKGVPAALLSSMIQASLRTQAGNERSTARIMANINSLVYQSTRAEQFATFFLAHVEEGSLQLNFCNAGHNYPLLYRKNGGLEELEAGGLILGVLDGAEFIEGSVALAAGDRIVFYTDGVSEAMNDDDDQFSDERLAELVATFPAEWTAEEIIEAILEEVYAFIGDQEAQDDVTIMVLRVLEPEPAEPGKQVAKLELESARGEGTES